MVYLTVRKIRFTATQIDLHVREKKRQLEKEVAVTHKTDSLGALIHGGVLVHYRLSY